MIVLVFVSHFVGMVFLPPCIVGGQKESSESFFSFCKTSIVENYRIFGILPPPSQWRPTSLWYFFLQWKNKVNKVNSESKTVNSAKRIIIRDFEHFFFNCLRFTDIFLLLLLSFVLANACT